MLITSEELAQRLGVDAGEVERLVDAGAIDQPAPGLFEPGDVHHVRLLLAFMRSGMPLDALVTAYRAGEVTFAYYDQLHPPVGPSSSRSFDDSPPSRATGRRSCRGCSPRSGSRSPTATPTSRPTTRP
jgi:hypothetical protein